MRVERAVRSSGIPERPGEERWCRDASQMLVENVERPCAERYAPRGRSPYLLFLLPPLTPERSGSAGAGAVVGATVGAGAAVGTGFGGSGLILCVCFCVAGFWTAGTGVVRVLPCVVVLVRPFALPRVPGGAFSE